MAFFASFFLLMCWYKSQSFVFFQDKFQFCSFDDFNSLLWGYYSFDLWLFSAVKLFGIIGWGDMVGIKSERGESRKICKMNNVIIILNDMKYFCSLDLECSVMLFYNFLWDLYGFCWLNKVFSSNIFEFICDPLHGLVKQLRYVCQKKHARGEIP